MPFYKPVKSPSERTVEGMANHWLLINLGSWHSWIFAPTQNEELGLGFDAALEGLYKFVVIQYKGTRKLKGKVAFDVDPVQRATLKATAGGHAYYAACSDRSYVDLAASFLATPPLFFERCYFISETALPPGARSIRVTPVAGSALPTITVHGIKGALIVTLVAGQFWAGPNFAAEVKACRIGGQLTQETIGNLNQPSEQPMRRNEGRRGRSFTTVLHRLE